MLFVCVHHFMDSSTVPTWIVLTYVAYFDQMCLKFIDMD